MTEQDAALKPAFLSALVSGAVLLAILSFTGAVWPYAPDETALAHLAFANAIALISFLSCAFLFCAASLARGVGWLDLLRPLANLLAVLVLFTGIVIGSNQVVEAMNSWFDPPPRMSPVMIRIAQIMALAGLLPLIVAILWRLCVIARAIVLALRRLAVARNAGQGERGRR